jgi:hypothetical protein
MRPNITSKSMDFTNVRVTLVQVTNDFRHGQTKQRSLNLLMAKLHHVIRFGHLIAEMLLLDTTQRYGSIVEVGFYRGLPGPLNFPRTQHLFPLHPLPSPPFSISYGPSSRSRSIQSASPVHPVGPSSQSVHSSHRQPYPSRHFCPSGYREDSARLNPNSRPCHFSNLYLKFLEGPLPRSLLAALPLTISISAAGSGQIALPPKSPGFASSQETRPARLHGPRTPHWPFSQTFRPAYSFRTGPLRR